MKLSMQFSPRHVNMISIDWIDLHFEPRDLWVGAYWKFEKGIQNPGIDWFDVYLCIVPMLPIRITLRIDRDNSPNLISKPSRFRIENGFAIDTRLFSETPERFSLIALEICLSNTKTNRRKYKSHEAYHQIVEQYENAISDLRNWWKHPKLESTK